MLHRTIIYLPLILTFITAGLSHAATSSVKVSAAVIRKNQCAFDTNISSMNLGVLDPERPVDKATSTSLILKCTGIDDRTNFVIGEDSSSVNDNLKGERQMRHETEDSSIPYKISVNNVTGEAQSDREHSIVVSVRVKGADYLNVYSGSYSDVVYVSISP